MSSVVADDFIDALMRIKGKLDSLENMPETTEEEPYYYAAKFNVVRYLMENKKYYEAREKMSELVEVYDQDERVEALYREASAAMIEENPNGFNYIVRGLYYLRAMDIDEAIADFEAAIEDDENDIAAWNDLGCCYLYRGQYEKAKELYEETLRRAPMCIEARNKLERLNKGV